MTMATKPASNGGGGLPPVIEREDGGDGRDGPTGDDWVLIAPPPPAGCWVVELRPRFAILNWEGAKQDAHKIPELPLVAANRAMLGIGVKRDAPIVLPRLLDEQTFSGDSKWAVSPLEPSGQYAIADDGSVLWCDEGNSDPAPKLPERRVRRKLRAQAVPPFGYDHWRAQAEFCLWHCECVTDNEAAFLHNITQNFDDLSEKQWEWLDRIFVRVRRAEMLKPAKVATPVQPRRRKLLTPSVPRRKLMT